MINWRLILHVLSFIAITVSLFMLFPILVALIYREPAGIAAFSATAGGSLVLFTILFLLTRRKRAFSLTTREGFLLVTLSWLVVSAVGAVPFMAAGTTATYTDAFFETMSGFSTTGATILTNIEEELKSVLFWRSLTHWLGGMGIVVLAVAILPLIGIGGIPLIQAESPGPRVDKIVPKVRETAKILWLMYLGLSALETILLLAGGMNLFDALTHTFGTMATGGFSTKNASIGHFSSVYIQVVITVFMVLAGVNFGLYYSLLKKSWGAVTKNTELKVYAAVFIISTLLIAGNLHHTHTYAGFAVSMQQAGFQAATILTTTGYATADFDMWPYFSRGVLLILMFIGGSSGSTGGGIKVIRIVVFFKLALNEMRHLLNPRGVSTIRINGEPIRKDMVYTVTGFIFLYIAFLLLITLLSTASGMDLLSSFSTALVTLGNIGPGFGLVGPVRNYQFMDPWLKWVLSIAMMIGRLEMYTVLVLLNPRFWKR